MACRPIFPRVADQWYRLLEIWQRISRLPARDTVIDHGSGDTQMDVGDALWFPLGQENVLKQPQNNVLWIFELVLDGASQLNARGSKELCRIWFKCHVL